MNRHSSSRQRGQILVLFALSLVAIIAAVGLVLDGGSAFAQRRSEQNAADVAALAALQLRLKHCTESKCHVCFFT